MRFVSRPTVLTAVLAVALAACGGDTTPATPPVGTDGPAAPITTAEALASPSDGMTGEDRSEELGGRWMIEYYRDASLARTNVLGDEPPFIDFGPDGSLTFHTSCNAGSGTYSTDGGYYVPESALDDRPEGQSLRLDDLAIDTATCEGFIGEQDTDLFNNFGTASRFVLDEGRLLLLDEFLLVEATPDG